MIWGKHLTDMRLLKYMISLSRLSLFYYSNELALNLRMEKLNKFSSPPPPEINHVSCVCCEEHLKDVSGQKQALS